MHNLTFAIHEIYYRKFILTSGHTKKCMVEIDETTNRWRRTREPSMQPKIIVASKPMSKKNVYVDCFCSHEIVGASAAVVTAAVLAISPTGMRTPNGSGLRVHNTPFFLSFQFIEFSFSPSLSSSFFTQFIFKRQINHVESFWCKMFSFLSQCFAHAGARVPNNIMYWTHTHTVSP